MRHPTYAFAQLTKCREPCTIAPDVDTVPNEKERLGFRRLLYDRQRSFMTMELVRVRDALIGSNALIVKARVDPNPDMLDNVIAPAMLSLNGSQGFDSPDGLLRLLINYVGDAAYGDSALRWSDGLPPTATFAHGQVLLACTCEGKLDYNQDAIIDAIKSQHQLDWKPYLAYMETQRAIGRITANSAGELRLRLQRTLETLNDDFLEAVERQLCRSGFPYQEIGMLEVEAEIRQLVEKVEGLPEAMTNAVSVGDPFNYSVSQLEELRKRGKVVRESIVQLRREQGETLLARAASLSGKEAEEAMDEAEIKLFSVMKSSGFDSAEAHVRLSKLYMKQNKLKLVVTMAYNIFSRCASIPEEAKDYPNFRWSIITFFRTGQPLESPNERGNLTRAEEKEAYRLLWKGFCYKLQAHIALCKEALGGEGVMTEDNIKTACEQRDAARESFQFAKETKDAPPTSEDELAELEDVYRERIAAHNQAVKAARRR